MEKYTNTQLDEAFTKGYHSYVTGDPNPYDEETEQELFEEWLDGLLFAKNAGDEA